MASKVLGDLFQGSGNLYGGGGAAAIDTQTGVSGLVWDGGFMTRSGAGGMLAAQNDFDQHTIIASLTGSGFSLSTGVAVFEVSVHCAAQFTVNFPSGYYVRMLAYDTTGSWNFEHPSNSSSGSFSVSPARTSSTTSVYRIEVEADVTRMYFNGALAASAGFGWASGTTPVNVETLFIVNSFYGILPFTSVQVLNYAHFKTETTSGELGTPVDAPPLAGPQEIFDGFVGTGGPLADSTPLVFTAGILPKWFPAAAANNAIIRTDGGAQAIFDGFEYTEMQAFLHTPGLELAPEVNVFEFSGTSRDTIYLVGGTAVPATPLIDVTWVYAMSCEAAVMFWARGTVGGWAEEGYGTIPTVLANAPAVMRIEIEPTAVRMYLNGDLKRTLDGGQAAGALVAFVEAARPRLTNETLRWPDYLRIKTGTTSGALGPATPAPPPTLTGVLSFDALTDTSYIVSWPTASGIGPITYRYSINGSSPTSLLRTSAAIGFRAPGTVDTITVWAVGPTGSVSAPITGEVTLLDLSPTGPTYPQSYALFWTRFNATYEIP